jgi:hypothetical protein
MRFSSQTEVVKSPHIDSVVVVVPPSAPTPPYPKQQEDGLATNIHRMQKHHDHCQARCEPPLKILGQ